MALCPTCFSVIGTWSDDPVLTTPALSLGYSGFSQINPTHIIELQNICNIKEIEAGLTPSSWTYIDNINIFQVIGICVQELRTAITNLVITIDSDMFHYFNYDAAGNYMGTTQTDWYDSDLNSNFVQIKAIHIEDLRHLANILVPVIEEGYLIAYGYNPEGKDINNISGIVGSVDVYEGDNYLGIAGDNIALSVGHHVIHVLFNGIMLDAQEVDIISGVTSTLEFIFSRVEYETESLVVPYYHGEYFINIPSQSFINWFIQTKQNGIANWGVTRTFHAVGNPQWSGDGGAYQNNNIFITAFPAVEIDIFRYTISDTAPSFTPSGTIILDVSEGSEEWKTNSVLGWNNLHISSLKMSSIPYAQEDL